MRPVDATTAIRRPLAAHPPHAGCSGHSLGRTCQRDRGDRRSGGEMGPIMHATRPHRYRLAVAAAAIVSLAACGSDQAAAPATTEATFTAASAPSSTVAPTTSVRTTAAPTTAATTTPPTTTPPTTTPGTLRARRAGDPRCGAAPAGAQVGLLRCRRTGDGDLGPRARARQGRSVARLRYEPRRLTLRCSAAVHRREPRQQHREDSGTSTHR